VRGQQQFVLFGHLNGRRAAACYLTTLGADSRASERLQHKLTLVIIPLSTPKVYATAKGAFIGAYFDDLDRKIGALTALAKSGYRDEALILCLVYLDGFAQLLSWPNPKVGANFVSALAQFSGDSQLALVHPKQLAEALDRLKGAWAPIAAAVRAAFPAPPYVLDTEVGTLTAIKGLTPTQRAQLQPEMWRGTMAAVAYFWMRNPAVHALGSSTLSFDQTTYNDQQVRPLDLPRLQNAAHGLAAEGRRRSEANDQWFGNDNIVITP